MPEIVEDFLSIDLGTKFASGVGLVFDAMRHCWPPTMQRVIAVFSPSYADNALHCDNFRHFFDATRHTFAA